MVVTELNKTFKLLRDKVDDKAKVIQKAIYKYRLIKKVKALNHYYFMD